MTVAFTPIINATGKLAAAELHFTEGPLAGLRLVGFEVWESSGGRRQVTFPARQWSVFGERRSFALLRPSDPDRPLADRALVDVILAAYREWEETQTAAAMEVGRS